MGNSVAQIHLSWMGGFWDKPRGGNGCDRRQGLPRATQAQTTARGHEDVELRSSWMAQIKSSWGLGAIAQGCQRLGQKSSGALRPIPSH